MLSKERKDTSRCHLQYWLNPNPPCFCYSLLDSLVGLPLSLLAPLQQDLGAVLLGGHLLELGQKGGRLGQTAQGRGGVPGHQGLVSPGGQERGGAEGIARLAVVTLGLVQAGERRQLEGGENCLKHFVMCRNTGRSSDMIISCLNEDVLYCQAMGHTVKALSRPGLLPN